MLTGKSVHNQRIERFWRDLAKDVVGFYKSLFESIQRLYMIDFDDPVSIFCLHYCFLSRINQDLKNYVETWNSHKIRTEKNRTPYQLLILNTGKSAAVEVPNDYGIEGDYESIEDEYEGEYEQVILPPIASPLALQFYETFSFHFQPLDLTMTDTNYMTTYFLSASTYCRQLLSLQHQN